MRESTFTLVYWGFIPSFPTKAQPEKNSHDNGKRQQKQPFEYLKMFLDLLWKKVEMTNCHVSSQEGCGTSRANVHLFCFFLGNESVQMWETKKPGVPYFPWNPGCWIGGPYNALLQSPYDWVVFDPLYTQAWCLVFAFWTPFPLRFLWGGTFPPQKPACCCLLLLLFFLLVANSLHPRCSMWRLSIYLQNWAVLGVKVGKYTLNLEEHPS